jgi:molybdenum cofactor cytidylyltransferase
MGRPKMLLPWGNTSVLGHLIGQWRDLGAKQIAVVRASDDAGIESELDRLGFDVENRISNPTPEAGMSSSIQCASRWRGWDDTLTHWAIVLGDQPHLRSETLAALLVFSAAHREQVCQPVRKGHGRHPVLLPKPIFSRLASSREPSLKDFLRAVTVAGCELNDPGLDLDIDLPEDYEKARALFAS